MAQAVCNLNLLPPSSVKNRVRMTRCLKFVKPSRKFAPAITAMAEDGRDNLDHLQRAGKQQPQSKRSVAPLAAPIALWDRFPTTGTVQQMMETMDRIMENPFAYSGWGLPQPNEAEGYGRRRTPWEIKEGESEYRMRFDMPGMTKEDVKIWVEDKMLVVRAEKEEEKKKKKAEPENEGAGEEEWSTKSYGRYSSRIALPDNIQFEKIKAEVRDGVLYITIPKSVNSGKVFDVNVR